MTENRVVTEVHEFTREELEGMARSCAWIALVGGRYVGGRYVGDLLEQTVEWLPNGSVRVTTRHRPVSLPTVR